MEKLKKLRSVTRRLFTSAASSLENKLEPPIMINELEAAYIFMKEKMDNLNEVENDIRNQWISTDDFDEEAFLEDQKITDVYKYKWIDLKNRYEKIKYERCDPVVDIADVNQQKSDRSRAPSIISNRSRSIRSKDSSSDEEGTIRSGKRKFTLPKIELRKFDGKIRNWLNFWGQFRKIDEDSAIDEDDKFQYLIQATEKGSLARQLVESYPPCGNNYKKAIEQLKSRFARDEMLVEIYVRELLNIVFSQTKEKDNLGLLYDKIVAQLRALETLNVTKDKYAAMLFPLVESALPRDILQAWVRTRELRKVEEENKEVDQLTSLLNFLKIEVEAEERIDITRLILGDREMEENSNVSKQKQSTAACIMEGNFKKGNTCLWCENNSHSSKECYKGNKMNMDEKRDIIIRKRACFICLKKGHSANRCKTFTKCLICSRRHCTIMCPQKNENRKKENVEKENNEVRSINTMVCHRTNITLLPTIMVLIKSSFKNIKVRALIDSGAQKSYITTELARRLELKPVGTESLIHYVFGGIETKQELHNVYNIIVKSLREDEEIEMKVLDKEKICGTLPTVSNEDLMVKMRHYNIDLIDMNDQADIELLIGADHSGIFNEAKIIDLGNNIIATKMKLGWIIQGPVKTASYAASSITSLVCNDRDLTDLWNLETLGIKDPAEVKSKEEHEEDIMQFYENTVKINLEGRYEVNLLWKEKCINLMTNRRESEKRLATTTKKLIANNDIEEYDQIFKEWLKLGIIEEVKNDDKNFGHYLPHHAVIKESSSTTRVRPVFDGSAKDNKGNCLNSYLDKGVNFLEMLPKMLIRFRKYAIGNTSDIEKAFLQISLNTKDRDYLKFLWWQNGKREEIITYRHCRVVFGIACSPFLLGATIKYHLDRAPSDLKETATKLRKSFYVDNCVYSVETREEANKFVEESKELMLSAKFNLRGWVIVPKENEDAQNILFILGLLWNTDSDELFCNINYNTLEDRTITKRVLLPYAQKNFDPVGFTSPVTLIPKLLLQKAWKLNIGWDKQLPDDIIKDFKLWWQDTYILKDCRIPRRLTRAPTDNCEKSLHTFSDASKHSYGACVFLRTSYKNKVTVQLILAKSRVAPLKNICIPRMELISAVIGVRLYKQVEEALELDNVKNYFWTDSSVVLTWIRKEAKWKRFADNRVEEIRENTNKEDWYHIPGQCNPADLPSRGCTAKTLIKSHWWEGPEWLYLIEERWPKSDVINENDEIVNKELEKRTSCNVETFEEPFSSRLIYFSKYKKLVRMVAWILRFFSNCYNKEKVKGDITNEEFMEAQNRIFRLIQREEHFGENSNKRFEIKLEKDNNDLFRVKTRLLLSDEDDNFKYPIVLPSKNIIIERLIQCKHEELNHAGLHILLAELRNSYWIISGRKLVKKVLQKCMVCKRHNTKACQTPFAPLPRNRTKYGAAFEVTGIDLAGPLYLSTGGKCYIVLFTCAIYRAIHLELVENLSTEAFLLALRRFIARRGRVTTIYTDNGSNFVGANNMMKEINWNEISSAYNVHPIKWYFNPPISPWWGGWWERMVRMVKELLRRVLGKALVNYVELVTVLYDIEATINARPLTYVSETDTLMPLTPNCFLQPIPRNEVPDLDEIDSKGLNKRLSYINRLRQDLRQRFRREYLALLVHRGKDKRNELNIGDIVLIESETKKTNWPLGIIVEVYPGADGHERVAKIKTNTGEKIRSFQKLYPLEISSKTREWLRIKHDENNKQDNMNKGGTLKLETIDENVQKNTEPAKEKRTRYGRVVTAPQRLNYL